MAYTPITTVQPNLKAGDDKLKELLDFMQADMQNKMRMEQYQKGLEAEKLQKNYGDLLANDPKALYPNLTDEDIAFVKGRDLPPSVMEQILANRSNQRTKELVETQNMEQFNAVYNGLLQKYPKYKDIIETRRMAGDDPSVAITEIEQYEFRKTSPKSTGTGGNGTETQSSVNKNILPSGNSGFMYYIPPSGKQLVKVLVEKGADGEWYYHKSTKLGGQRVPIESRFWVGQTQFSQAQRDAALKGAGITISTANKFEGRFK